MKPRIVVTRQIFPDQLERLRQVAEVVDNQAAAALDSAALIERMASADAALVTVFDPITAALLQRAPRLKVVSSVGAGADHIDHAACASAGVVVTTTPGVVDHPTADLAFALLLSVARRVCEANAYVRAGQWTGPVTPLFGLDVHHRTLGIVGLGRIGREIARRASGFEMKVVYAQRQRASALDEQACAAQRLPLQELLAVADFVVVQVPFTPETHHLIGAAELALMKKTAVLINTARGGVVDDIALAAALKAGTIAGAGLDVVEGEPLVNAELLSAPNLTLLPHLGSATQATRHAMVAMAVDNLIACLARSH